MSIQTTKNFFHHHYGTTAHKAWVLYYVIIFCAKLLWRAIIHDISKYSYVESHGFIKIIHLLKSSTYGTKEYKETLETIKPSLEHHYKCNRHHPEFHQNGIIDMNLLDVIELFIDWKSATKRHSNGNIIKSIEINSPRFEIDNQLTSMLTNTTKIL